MLLNGSQQVPITTKAPKCLCSIKRKCEDDLLLGIVNVRMTCYLLGQVGLWGWSSTKTDKVTLQSVQVITEHTVALTWVDVHSGLSCHHWFGFLQVNTTPTFISKWPKHTTCPNWHDSVQHLVPGKQSQRLLIKQSGLQYREHWYTSFVICQYQWSWSERYIQ